MLVRSFIVSIAASTLLLVHFCNLPEKEVALQPGSIDSSIVRTAETSIESEESDASLLLATENSDFQPANSDAPGSVLDRSIEVVPKSASTRVPEVGDSTRSSNLLDEENSANSPAISPTFAPPTLAQHSAPRRTPGQPVCECHACQSWIADQPSSQSGHHAMQVDNYGLLYYRRMMLNGTAPHPVELQGSWRGINKGLATVAIDKQFIKHFRYVNGQLYGDNISVQQVHSEQLGQYGWRPVRNPQTGGLKRGANFLFRSPRGTGPFRHAAILDYQRGGNSRRDPANLVVDRIVKLDDNHMLGRATVKLGLVRIPLAFFVLERIPDHQTSF